MHPVDVFVVKSALLSFALFCAVFLPSLRFLPPAAVLIGIVRIFAAVTVVHLVSGVIALAGMPAAAGPLTLFTASGCLLVSLVLYGLMSFLFIVCVFGPFETSVRLRILRELSAAPQGLSEEQLFFKYNNRIIIQRRLDKLLCSKKVSFDGRVYRLKKKMVFFVLTEIWTSQMKRWFA